MIGANAISHDVADRGNALAEKIDAADGNSTASAVAKALLMSSLSTAESPLRGLTDGRSRLFCGCGCCVVARTCTCFCGVLAQQIPVPIAGLTRIEADTNPRRDCNQPTSPAERLPSLRLPCQLPTLAVPSST
jgi:hypothetical protein